MSTDNTDDLNKKKRTPIYWLSIMMKSPFFVRFESKKFIQICVRMVGWVGHGHFDMDFDMHHEISIELIKTYSKYKKTRLIYCHLSI